MSEKDKDKKDHKGGKAPHPEAAKAAEKKARKARAAQDAAAVESNEPQAPAPPPRLQIAYKERIVPKNILAVPRLEKIVISMGLGKAVTGGEKGKLEQAEKELGVIAGQRPVRCKAKKSVANFKVREGMETGLKVTLRGGRMYEFLDRLITLAIPRVKDFRGLNPTGFDKSGNFNFGFTEQTVFPEVDAAAVTFQQGMNITMVTTAKDPNQGRELLKMFGMPFRDDTKQEK
jgi:large subunit ribosomal protein L5